MKKIENQISLILLCIILGVLMAVQFRTQKNIGFSLSSSRVEELTLMLKEAEKERDALKLDIGSLRTQLSDYEKAASEGKSMMEAINQELEKARTLAGLTKLRGPGVIVYLEDSDLKASPGEDPNIFIVHYEDLLQIINELFSAGAEAVSLNEQRIIANSEIRCAGPTILINGVRIASPYEISAIGDTKTLESALNMRGGIVEMLKAVGIKVNILERSRIIIPAFLGSVTFRYAKIVKER